MKPTDREFFEAAHADGDPWDLADDAYEQARYDTVIRQVPAGRYPTAFEPGCSVGELTARLAGRCRRVEAIDIAQAAVEQATRRCAGAAGVTIRQGALPGGIPDHEVDLIAFVEIGYYFEPDILAGIVRSLDARLAAGGRFVAAHWIGRSSDHVITGEAVHEMLRSTITAPHVLSEVHPDRRRDGFVLDVWDHEPAARA